MEIIFHLLTKSRTLKTNFFGEEGSSTVLLLCLTAFVIIATCLSVNGSILVGRKIGFQNAVDLAAYSGAAAQAAALNEAARINRQIANASRELKMALIAPGIGPCSTDLAKQEVKLVIMAYKIRFKILQTKMRMVLSRASQKVQQQAKQTFDLNLPQDMVNIAQVKINAPRQTAAVRFKTETFRYSYITWKGCVPSGIESDSEDIKTVAEKKSSPFTSVSVDARANVPPFVMPGVFKKKALLQSQAEAAPTEGSIKEKQAKYKVRFVR
jgi:hypothetical protein